MLMEPRAPVDIHSPVTRRASPGRSLLHRQLNAAIDAQRTIVAGLQSAWAINLALMQSWTKDGLATSAGIASCRDLEEVMELQIDHLKVGLQLTSDEFGRMARLINSTASDLVALWHLPAVPPSLYCVAPGAQCTTQGSKFRAISGNCRKGRIPSGPRPAE